MDVFYHTKKTTLYSFCSGEIKTNNVDHVMLHTQKRGTFIQTKYIQIFDRQSHFI
jgi:hypothetical protein